jgi:hypothetical protein
MLSPKKAHRISLQMMLLLNELSIAEAFSIIKLTEDNLLQNHKVNMSSQKNTTALEAVGLLALPSNP